MFFEGKKSAFMVSSTPDKLVVFLAILNQGRCYQTCMLSIFLTLPSVFMAGADISQCLPLAVPGKPRSGQVLDL